MTRPDFYSFGEFDVLCALIAGEAAGEGPVGQQAVAFVALNRLDRGFGHDLKDVCLKPFQFSCFDDARRHIDMVEAADKHTLVPWALKLREAVLAAYTGQIPDVTRGADHYFSDWAKERPKWAEGMDLTAIIGRHLFFDSGRRGPSA